MTITAISDIIASVSSVGEGMEQTVKDDPKLGEIIRAELIRQNIALAERSFKGRTVVNIEHSPLEFGVEYFDEEGRLLEKPRYYTRVRSKVWHGVEDK